MLNSKILVLGITFLAILAISPLSVVAHEDSANKGKRFDIQKLEQKFASKEAEMKERFQQKHEKFKEKLQNISDERKQKILEELDTRIESTNAKRTAHMTGVLNKLTEILNKIIQREQVLKAQGIDTTTAQTAISKAQTALTQAKTAVNTQSVKEYTISLENQDNIKQTVGGLLKELQSDLRTTHALVKEAKEAIWEAHNEVKKLQGTLTPTVSPSPTEG